MVLGLTLADRKEPAPWLRSAVENTPPSATSLWANSNELKMIVTVDSLYMSGKGGLRKATTIDDTSADGTLAINYSFIIGQCISQCVSQCISQCISHYRFVLKQLNCCF